MGLPQKAGRISVIAACLVIANGLAAADLTAFIGGVKPGKLDINNIRTSLDSSPVFGFRLGTSFVPKIGMEHTLAFSSDFLFPTSLSAIKEAKGFLYSSNVIVSLPGRRVVPYATAGVGLIHQYGSQNLPVGTKFAFNYGGGLKFRRLLGPLGLRIDVRGYKTAAVFSKRLNLFEASAGLLISF